jgi:hypothetical protein
MRPPNFKQISTKFRREFPVFLVQYNMTEYLSVSTLTKYLKTKFDRDPYLERVFLTGEISNFRRRPKHQYFCNQG